MSNKRLVRVDGINLQHCRELAKHGVNVCKDVLTKNVLELMNFGLSYQESLCLFELVSKTVAPRPVKVSEFIQKKTQWFLSTHLKDLDHCLHGGLTSGTITEVTGPPGSGKTQLCIMLSSLTVIDSLATRNENHEPGSVVYIDTENAFTAKRLLEISSFHMVSQKSEKIFKEIASNVIVFFESNFNGLISRLKNLEELIISKNVRLIIVDSIASLARKEFGGHQLFAERNNMLMKEATLLKFYAERFNIPVLVTNQVTTNIGSASRDSCLIAALGNTWAHAVNTRLMVRYTNETNIRELLVAKSPLCPLSKFYYKIDCSGIVPID